MLNHCLKLTKCMFVAIVIACTPGWAQAQTPAQTQAQTKSTPVFKFASLAEGKNALGARDDFVRAVSPLERSARLRTVEPVAEDQFIQHMQSAAVEWSAEQRKVLAPVLEEATSFLAKIKWKMPDTILLVQADPSLENAFPHTRGNAIIIPAGYMERRPERVKHVIFHEIFHVLSRANAELRERLYATVGFKRCETVTISPEITNLRITNPDVVQSRHSIAVRFQGKTMELLPFARFSAADVDTRAGFFAHLMVSWLVIDRTAGDCVARDGGRAEISPDEVEGFYEQIGRNTNYVFHAEELLADNFDKVVQSASGGSNVRVSSPDILEKIRKVLLE